MTGSLLLLLDDIASVLDDVAAMTKVAAKKTAGVLGDDLALNAKQVTGVAPVRELPVVWAVARGSAVNKAVLVPAALLTSWLAPWAIPPLLILGGAFLCYEGAEKILHAGPQSGNHGHDQAGDPVSPGSHDPAGDSGKADPGPSDEPRRIAGAIRTDFILSAEIIVITLGLVAGRPLATQIGVLVAVAILMTIGVYGVVAAIVKLDDLGMALATRRSAGIAALGRGIVAAAPWLMRALSVAGTAAMFLVGGGIIVHQLPAVHEFIHDAMSHFGLSSHAEPSAAGQLARKSADALFGLTLGLLTVGVIGLGRRAAGGPRITARHARR